MSRSKFFYAVTQLEKIKTLHPNTHIFHQYNFYQTEPNIVIILITHFLFKTGLKHWENKIYNVTRSEIKQLHYRDMCRPKHWYELIYKQKIIILEPYIFLKKQEKQEQNSNRK